MSRAIYKIGQVARWFDSFITWRPYLLPRRIHVYCLGTAKSGTHSVHAIFSSNYRAAHEPAADSIISYVIAKHQRLLRDEDARAHFMRLDRKLQLEVNSSQLNFFFLDEIVDEFPNAKMILTIRDCYSWLDSFINHQLGRNSNSLWDQMREIRFGDVACKRPSYDKPLVERGLYSLDSYFSYWARHNQKVLTDVNPDRLLVLKTQEIGRKLGDVAHFVGVPLSSLASERSHAFKAPAKFDVLRLIDRQYLEGKAMQHCGDIMCDWFPEIRSLDDALLL